MLQRSHPIPTNETEHGVGIQMLAWAGCARRRAVSGDDPPWNKALARQRIVRAREYAKPRLPC